MLENHEKSICAMQETSLDIQDIRILVLVLATMLGLGPPLAACENRPEEEWTMF